MEKLTETTAAQNLRLRLCKDLGSKYLPNGHAFFFEHTYVDDLEKIREQHLLDALYTALMCPEHLIAFRAYVQAVSYTSEPARAPLRYRYETAFFEARYRIENVLRGCK